MTHIPKLIRNTVSFSYHFINVSMRMTIYPIVYVAISYEVSKFRSEGTVYRTAHEVRGYQFIRWYMMRCHYNVFSLTFANGFFYESTAFLMLLIKSLTIYHNITILNTIEVIDHALCSKSILRFNMSPKS